MSAQTRYGFSSPIGFAGGIYDLSPYTIDALLNEEETGKMGFGVGVVTGSNAGVGVKLPESSDTAAVFEGVTVNNRTTELDTEGKLSIKKGASVNIMRYGRIYVRVASGVEPKYGDTAYLVTSGDEAGYFTNTKDSNAIAIKGRFLGSLDGAGTQIALVELFNQAQDIVQTQDTDPSKDSDQSQKTDGAG